MFSRIDHVGIVVQNLDDALATYRDALGCALLQRLAIPEQNVEAAFLDTGNGTIELIAPTDTESGTARFLQNRGEGTHHICFEVPDIAAALASLQRTGATADRRDPATRGPRLGGLCASQGDPRRLDRATAEAGSRLTDGGMV